MPSQSLLCMLCTTSPDLARRQPSRLELGCRHAAPVDGVALDVLEEAAPPPRREPHVTHADVAPAPHALPPAAALVIGDDEAPPALVDLALDGKEPLEPAPQAVVHRSSALSVSHSL